MSKIEMRYLLLLGFFLLALVKVDAQHQEKESCFFIDNCETGLDNSEEIRWLKVYDECFFSTCDKLDFKNIRFLNAASLELDSFFLPKAICASLEELRIENNFLKNVSNSNLHKATLLTYLEVGGNSDLDLISFANEIRNLKKLTHLGLGYCNISRLPTSISKHQSLSVLSLAGNPELDWNQLVDILQGEKSRIDTLYLMDCNISDNSFFFRPVNISFLDLSNNQLTQFSSENYPLGIEHLNLTMNEISTVSSNIYELSKLKSLELMMNDLHTIPEEFSKLRSLETVSFMNNPSFDAEEVIKRECLPIQLRSLDLSGTDIDSIPEEIKNLVSLTELKLWNNHLEDISNLRLLKNLSFLSIEISAKYKLSEVLQVLSECHQLKALFIKIPDDSSGERKMIKTQLQIKSIHIESKGA